MKRSDKLHAYWGKRLTGKDTKIDSNFMFGVFNREFLAEMTSRGYDVKTLRFSIEPQQGSLKFAATRPSEAKE